MVKDRLLSTKDRLLSAKDRLLSVKAGLLSAKDRLVSVGSSTLQDRLLCFLRIVFFQGHSFPTGSGIFELSKTS